MSNREAAKPRPTSAIEKDHRDAVGKLTGIRQGITELSAAWDLRVNSGAAITEADISGHKQRKAELERTEADLEQLVIVLGSQLLQAVDREWVERKSKRRRTLDERLPEEKAVYKQLAECLKTAETLCSVVRGFHLEREQFNRTSDERVGYVELPEQIIRGGAGIWRRPLWDVLARLPHVYPADGLIEIKVGNLPAEEGPPKPPAPPKADAPPPRELPKFVTTRPPQTDEPPAEERPFSLARTVHSANRSQNQE